MSKDGMGGYDLPSEDDKEKPRSSKAASEHDNLGQLHLSSRRGPDGPVIIYHMDKCDQRLWTEKRDWHFREVRPGEIALTRDEWLKLKNDGLAGLWRGKHQSMIEFMQAKLFPEGTEVTK